MWRHCLNAVMAPKAHVAWVLSALSFVSVRAAVNLNGDRVVNPVGDKDPSPIADPRTYYPDQHDCPLPYSDYSNIHAWTPYFSVERLHRCEQPMLLQFSVTQPLKTSNNTSIRGCTLETSEAKQSNSFGTSANSKVVDNPKKSDNLVDKSLDVAAACVADGVETDGSLTLSTTNSGSQSGGDIASFLVHTQKYFDESDNCDESFLFAYHRSLVASLYIGQSLGKPTVASTVQALTSRLQSETELGNRTIAQVCGKGRKPEHVFGIAIDTNGDLSAVQDAALSWSQGKCVSGGENMRPFSDGLDFKLFDVAEASTKLENSSVPEGNDARSPDSAKRGKRFNVKRAPSRNADGTCATHIIQNGDTCSALAERHGITVADLERFNQGKTWAWTECKDMLLGYNMCLSEGNAPIPPPQAGTECGPMLPGTKQPTDSKINMDELNPCPLKACCSNWGFCGPFAMHCDVHAPANGGPGAKLPEFQNTCISNCGNEIKQNSGPPATFERIGYYESWNLGRDCLWLKAYNADTDGTYTHMHWGFAEIDPKTWKVVLVDPHKQWDHFKQLGLKRIVSFGGWAYSTEPATYNIIRQAIINNRETFAQNLAQFVRDEDIDGVDIDWEYPGAPDIMVDGKPIGQPGDGLYYLRFLTRLKQLLPNKSVSIAAPASYWYLKAFPIDEIAKVIDYIVYMTYDLHGQWDYGNVNAFDSCPSGKCIRSHVTKAGVANNKIFVGEYSYGRSFHMASDGCYGPMCELTGTRTESDAQPGRCTGTGGYISNAEIFEPINSGVARQFHDRGSNSDYIVYNGDVEHTRREDWRKLNFAGSIDWAVDLQRFGAEDFNAPLDLPGQGEEGCVIGIDRGVDSGDLCNYGYCPPPLCECIVLGEVERLPHGVETNMRAWDDQNLELNKLCKFACKYGRCPKEVCVEPEPEPDSHGLITPYNPDDYYTVQARLENAGNCIVFENTAMNKNNAETCYGCCKDIVESAKEEGRITNYGCVGFFPFDEGPIPWIATPGYTSRIANGKCSCDNALMNWFAGKFLEVLLAIIGCFIMSSLKHILDIGISVLTGGTGRIVGAGYVTDVDMKPADAVTVAAELASYTYPEGEDPAGAFTWWLIPCGNDLSLVPEELRKAFDILSAVTPGMSSFRAPKYPKGQGRKDDEGNPTDQSQPRAPPRGGTNDNNNQGSNPKKKQCKPFPSKYRRMGPGKNTIHTTSCDANGNSVDKRWVITSNYGTTPKQVGRECKKEWDQACLHYSSVISNNAAWGRLTCPLDSGTKLAPVRPRRAPRAWTRFHNGGQNGVTTDWMDKNDRPHSNCQADEWPPIYLVNTNEAVYQSAGIDAKGQLVRYLPGQMNQRAGQSMIKGACFAPLLSDLSDADFERLVAPVRALNSQVVGTVTNYVVQASERPYFTITAWNHARAPNDGLDDNGCWPNGKAPMDPGYALYPYDPYYNNKLRPYDYRAPYVPGINGA
ncbi:Killer toxin subunits alpha/beta [Paramyrothecium foliicola]|nr:Killer toxin subunits alpha/beta [Paramyrothecium foliicola]